MYQGRYKLDIQILPPTATSTTPSSVVASTLSQKISQNLIQPVNVNVDPYLTLKIAGYYNPCAGFSNCNTCSTQSSCSWCSSSNVCYDSSVNNVTCSKWMDQTCSTTSTCRPGQTCTYQWSYSSWSACVSCQQFRYPICVDSGNVQVEESKCAATKPAILYQSCGSCTSADVSPSQLLFIMKLAMDYNSIPEGSVQRQQFVTQFINQISQSLNIESKYVSINSINNGSIIVNFTISSSPTQNALQSVLLLRSYISNSNSPLYQYNITSAVIASFADSSYQYIVGAWSECDSNCKQQRSVQCISVYNNLIVSSTLCQYIGIVNAEQSCPVCPAASSKSYILYIGVAIGAVVLIIIAAVIFKYIKKRNSTNMENHQQLELTTTTKI